VLHRADHITDCVSDAPIALLSHEAVEVQDGFLLVVGLPRVIPATRLRMLPFPRLQLRPAGGGQNNNPCIYASPGTGAIWAASIS